MRVLAFSLAVALALPLAAAAAPADVFQEHCKTCHGKGGKGDTKLGQKYGTPDFTSPEFQEFTTDAEIRATIMNGKKGTKMKSWKNLLTPEEIDGLVLYIRALGRGAGGASRAAGAGQ